MTNFMLIGVCIIAGILFRQRRLLPPDAHKGINAWIIYLALPAVSLHYIPQIKWNASLLLPVAAPILVWLCAWVYIRLYARHHQLPRQLEAGLKLMTGLSNTSFVGFPLVAAWFGEQYIGIAIIVDQVTFLLLATAGIAIAMNASGDHKLRLNVLVKKLFSFPPLLACLVALAFPSLVSSGPPDQLFIKLGGTVGPLALFSIGLQLQFKGWEKELQHIRFVLLFKLMLAPLLALCLALALGIKNDAAHIAVFELAMPTLLTSGIIAEQYNLQPKTCNLIIGIGIVLSFITTTAWYYIITTLL